MRTANPRVPFVLVLLAILPCACTYFPYVVFSNLTASPLRVELEFTNPSASAKCPAPRLSFMPSAHAKRRWRPQAIRAADPGAAEFDAAACRLSATIPPETALQVQIAEYYGWTGEDEQDLLALVTVSLEGAKGSITVSGPMVVQQFDARGLAYFVWEYGRT